MTKELPIKIKRKVKIKRKGFVLGRLDVLAPRFTLRLTPHFTFSNSYIVIQILLFLLRTRHLRLTEKRMGLR